MSDAARHGVLVLGPYRSGTSLTCVLLEHLGVDFGPHDAFWRPDRFNPRGFYERLDVNHANGVLMESAGRTIVDPIEPPELSQRGNRRVLHEADLSWRPATGLWGLKDPRLCIALTAWIDEGQLDPAELIVVRVRRGRDAVVRSVLNYPTLERLLGGDAERAGAMTDEHERWADWHIEQMGTPVHEVRFEQLIDDPHTVTAGLAAFIGVSDRRSIARAAGEVGRKRAMWRYRAGRVKARVGRLARKVKG